MPCQQLNGKERNEQRGRFDVDVFNACASDSWQYAHVPQYAIHIADFSCSLLVIYNKTSTQNSVFYKGMRKINALPDEIKSAAALKGRRK